MRADGKTTQRKEKGGERGRGMGTEFNFKKKKKWRMNSRKRQVYVQDKPILVVLKKKGNFLVHTNC